MRSGLSNPLHLHCLFWALLADLRHKQGRDKEGRKNKARKEAREEEKSREESKGREKEEGNYKGRHLSEFGPKG